MAIKISNAEIREIGRKLDELLRDPDDGRPFKGATTEGNTLLGVFAKLSLSTRLMMDGKENAMTVATQQRLKDAREERETFQADIAKILKP